MRVWLVSVMVGAVCCVGMGNSLVHGKGADDTELAQLLIELLRAGRAVVSEHQSLINDASKGEKGFTDKFLVSQVLDKFKAKTRMDLSRPQGIPHAEILLAMLESQHEAVREAQPIINKQGIAFKGFVPSVFGRKTGQKLFVKTGIGIKLTGIDYRFSGNKPDDFEAEVLRMFADPRHPKGQRYAKVTMLNGNPVMRVMDPEYASASCLTCHGGPKGERDMSGMKKEGWKEGDLAGAISVILPLR
ncbi:MAG: DUF3365 domain-containing protein [Nitrospira sp.]|nr:DUF3365 domain-containing protein [Nitrospira sp.]